MGRAYWCDDPTMKEPRRCTAIGLFVLCVACALILFFVYVAGFERDVYDGSCPIDEGATALACRYYVGPERTQQNVTWSQAAIDYRGDCTPFVDNDGEARMQVRVATVPGDPTTVLLLSCYHVNGAIALESYHRHWTGAGIVFMSLSALGIAGLACSPWLTWWRNAAARRRWAELYTAPPAGFSIAMQPGGYNAPRDRDRSNDSDDGSEDEDDNQVSLEE